MLGKREGAEIDVLVVGGGAAGVPAAIQAASMGARTMLVEKNGALGGTTTVAGVALPGLFHAWGHQVIAGIGWRLVTTAVRVAGDVLPDFSDWRLPHYKLQVPVNAALYAGVLDAEVLQAGVDPRLPTMVGAVEPAMPMRWPSPASSASGTSSVSPGRSWSASAATTSTDSTSTPWTPRTNGLLRPAGCARRASR